MIHRKAWHRAIAEEDPKRRDKKLQLFNPSNKYANNIILTEYTKF